MVRSPAHSGRVLQQHVWVLLRRRFKSILLASFDSRSSSYISPDCWEREKNTNIMDLIFILFVCTSWNGLRFAFLTSLVNWHKVHPFVLLNLHCGCFRSQSAHPGGRKDTKSLADPLDFSLF